MFKNPAEILDSLDMEEHVMLLTCLLTALDTDTIYQAALKTKDILESNGREDAARYLEEICSKMLSR